MSRQQPSIPVSSRVRVNLTQLNAFNQYIISRTAVMLTTGGLAAAAGGIIERLHPGVDRIAPGITPWLLYLAALLIPISILISFFNLLMDSKLQLLLTHRFGEENQSEDQIDVCAEDFKTFKHSHTRKLMSLDISFALLLIGSTALALHTYELYVSDYNLIDKTFDAYQSMNWYLTAIVLVLGFYVGRRLKRRLKRLSMQPQFDVHNTTV